MKKTEQQIQQEVDSTLESLDGIQKASANPYLFTRIQARLQKQPSGTWEGISDFLTRPVVAIATILIVIVVNLAVFFNNSNNTTPAAQDNEQLFASEYNLASNSIYETTMEQQ